MNQKIERKKRAKVIAKELQRLFPNADMALKYSNNWELLVAVILSAQCTDVMVNKITKDLFKKYPRFVDYINADLKEFSKDIYKAGFYNSKAKNIIAAAKLINRKWGGKIPRDMPNMLMIPGVARKTANVVLGNAFGIVEGIAIDTHVKRFAKKFDLSDSTDPKQIERDFMDLFDKQEWFSITYRFIEYGRQICKARKHDCVEHPLTKLYPKANSIWPKAR